MATLLVRKGETNWLTVTAQELSTSESPIYKFVFTHDTEQIPKEINLTDESEFKDSYNLFKLIEGTDLSLITGQYEYKIYDSNNALVEVGKMIVLSTDEEKTYANEYNNQNNFIFS